MSQPYRVQLCRIVAPEKVSDRFLASGTLQQRDGWSVADQVVIAYLFEITRPWFASSTVFEAIVATLAEHLPSLVPGEAFADQFERVLQKVNQALGAVSDQGETDWIGSFNGMIMAIGGEELHFSQTGSCPAYLLQNNRIRQITDHDQDQSDPHPLKTFVNLASGSIADGDQILIGNHELYRELSLDALRRIISGTSSFQAATTITRELKRVRNAGVQAAIIGIGAAEAADEPTAIFLEEELRTPVQKLTRFLKPILRQAGDTAGKVGTAGVAAASQAGTTLTTHVAPKALTLIKEGLREARRLGQDVAGEIAGKHPVAPSEAPVAGESVADDEAPIVYRVYPRSSRSAVLRANPLSQVLPQLKNGWQAARAFAATLRGRKTLLAGAAVALLIATVGIAVSRRSSAANVPVENKNATILEALIPLEAKIKSAVKLDQQIEASRDIETAQQQLRQIANPSVGEKEQAAQLWNSITTLSDQLTQTTRFSSWNRSTDLGAAGTKLAATQSGAKVLSEGGRSLIVVANGSPTPLALSIPGSNDNAAAITNGGDTPDDAFVLTTQSKLYRLANGSGQLEPVTLQGNEGFAKGDVVGTYYGNLYVVDTVNGLLWKYAGSDGQYQKGVSVIDKAQYDIKGSISMAIDGSIYLLRKDGAVQKFTRGQQDTSFTLKNQPELSKKLVQPLQISASEDSENIYILDGGLTSDDRSTAKLLVFDKSGVFTGQYAFPAQFTRVRSFAVDPAKRILWIVNENTLYEFGL